MQRRWQDGCRIWPLLARGFGHTLYVVPGGVCTTACWTCQALIHVRDKLHSAYAPHVPKEQTLAAQEASARIVRRGPCRPPGRHPSGRSQPAWTADRASGPGPSTRCRESRAGCPPPPTGSTRAPAGRCAASPGCHHPARAGALLPFGFTTDRDHGRTDVRAPDRRVHRVAWTAPGLRDFGAAGFPRGIGSSGSRDSRVGVGSSGSRDSRVCKKADRVTVLEQDANNLPGGIRVRQEIRARSRSHRR